MTKRKKKHYKIKKINARKEGGLATMHPESGVQDSSKSPSPTKGKRHIRWGVIGFFIGLILGLIPLVFQVTPLYDYMHPITINPSTITANSYPYDTISYFNITNNRNITLYQVQIKIDLPEGLTEQDIEVNKLTQTDSVVVEIPGDNGSIMWDTSIMLIGGYDEKSHFITMYLDRVLPGESNIMSFSISVKATEATEPIVLSCVGYSKKPGEIFSGSSD
jgi:hypothetical protein